ncbi:zf-TFIIB domain-containing protein [Streptomyces smyrnaeus]|uniref:TFIIB-type zinc ribbon-containing protein n=1 Tax=Streptomyces TaxID=1883 RepID=UPI0015D4E056|nr:MULTISPECIES: zf-TFIIB domain-containing protein [unclassified Streptomyces]MBQ0865626.1 zf-TFIIB domain-containing protein [Streptomyces sp. RK75]MBQ1124446.1 zf-TFIIB domain-containing protein [Streptomyces sp. B15]MBQ1158959.1 zf-TFIIB domain-containing protein [Streptomyces sp. A73]
MQCPKCGAPMRTYNRNGVQIEQCDNCRGIFLDYGELESLTRLEAQWAQSAPPPPGPQAPQSPQAYPAGPAWGAPHHGQHGHGSHGHGHHGHGHRGGHHDQRGFGRMLFSS